jgi:hypothetical protein
VTHDQVENLAVSGAGGPTGSAVRSFRFHQTMSPTAPPTSLELLQAQVEEVRSAFSRLLHHVQLDYHDVNAGGAVMFLGWNPYRWGDLTAGGQRFVGEARRSWEPLYELAAQSVRLSAPERISRLEESAAFLQRIIEQDDTYGAPASSVDAIRAAVEQTLTGVGDLLRELPSAHGDGGRLLVPDTNALLFKPELADWSPPSGPWTVVLVPQVLRELDAIKMRSNDVGQKANGVIRRIKEYARRGDSFFGVPIAGSLTMREIAIDPDMSSTLSWLQAGHGDDELLASVLDLRCADLNAVVVLATRDRNLQNKARLARIPYLDVENEL